MTEPPQIIIENNYIDMHGGGGAAIETLTHNEKDKSRSHYGLDEYNNNGIKEENVIAHHTTTTTTEMVPPTTKSTTSTTTTMTTTTTTTTTTMATTIVPPRYCAVQRSHQSEQHIAEGKSRRVSHDVITLFKLFEC